MNKGVLSAASRGQDRQKATPEPRIGARLFHPYQHSWEWRSDILTICALRMLLFTVVALFAQSICAGVALSPFDYEKARSMSDEKHHQYDLVFFNEMETWNLNSNRYGTDSHIKRRSEFEKMATDGYLPAYLALRLAQIWPATPRHDREAFDLLLKTAKAGDATAMCALVVIPIVDSLWPEAERLAAGGKFMIGAAEKGQGACEAYYGGALLLGNIPGITQNRAAAMPLLLDSAKQGYYVAAKRLFYLRQRNVFSGTFDFSDRAEVERALCWGRLAQQHTNWAGFEFFLEKLRDYARANKRVDLMDRGNQFDPKRVPITKEIVTPENCVQLEKGE